MTQPETIRQEFTLRDTFAFLRHQRSVYLVVLVIVMAIWAIASFVMPAVYQAVTVVTLEGRTGSNGPTSIDPLDRFSLDPTSQDVLSLMEVLRSEVVLRDAFGQANVVLPPPGRDVAQPTVQVQQVGMTRVVEISVQWTNAEEAQRIAAAIPSAYNAYMVRERSAVSDQALDFIAQREKSARAALATAEQRLRAFDEKRKSLSPENASGELGTRATTLEMQSKSADAALASARSRYETLQAAFRKISNQTVTRTTETNLKRIEDAKRILEDLQLRRRGLLAQYTEQSPLVKEVDSQIVQQQRLINALPKEIVTNTVTRNPQIDEYRGRVDVARADYEAALAAASKARASADLARNEVQKYVSESPERNALVRAVQGQGSALTALLEARDELNARKSALRPSASVVTNPYVNEVPVRPRPALYLAIALIAWAILGTGVALLREQFDDRILGVEDVYKDYPSLPTMGIVPSLSGRRGVLARADDPDAYNSLRLLQFGINEFIEDPNHRTVAVMSEGRREGKTTLAVNLAQQLASQRKTILVDADFLRPRIGRTFNIESGPGLSDVLLGKVPVESALKQIGNGNLYVLTAGSSTDDAIERLGTDEMKSILETLSSMADVVVLDTMPILASADATAMAPLVDGVLLALRLGHTKREAAFAAVQQLNLVRANLLGYVFTQARKQR